MNIGMMGVGKLGLPVEYTFASRGHKVYGYDLDPEVYRYVEERTYPQVEEGLPELMENHTISMVVTPEDLVKNSDIVFVAIQTPHEKEFDGTQPLTARRKDFDYQHLRSGLSMIAEACLALQKHTTVVIVSTVLPGTFDKYLKPVLNDFVHIVYEPMFIAMGTVVSDALNPEFVLCGVAEQEPAKQLEEFYKTIHDRPVFKTDIRTAEGIKVLYNTFITTKTVLGNMYGEMAHKLGMNVDDIYGALTMATDRIISPRYLKAGVADGGGCHPRDNIALSWLADECGMSFNYFDALMTAREEHMGWIGDMAIYLSETTELPVFILGQAFKPETKLTDGSPSILLANLISRTRKVEIIPEGNYPTDPGVYIIGVAHKKYKDIEVPEGSIVIDPFRYREEQDGVTLIRIGENSG